MKKIEAVLPAIDELYKDYAEKNHFPGFTYGLVVDGKLVHTGRATRMWTKRRPPRPNRCFGWPP